MFQVGRFDPEKEAQKERKQQKAQKPKKRKREGKQEQASTLRVIAPDETKEPKATDASRRLADEALDDFDEDPLLLETQGMEDLIPKESEPVPSLPKDVACALHMSNLPIDEAAKVWELAPFLVNNLKRDGCEHFFPIQSLVIPDIIASERHSQILQSRDVCVAAPTGSGKTLAFVLPLLNALSGRIVRRLRALVVLPSRDLASQVYTVFSRYADGSDLSIGLAIGQSDFRQEQRAILVGDYDPMEDATTTRLRHDLDPTNLELALAAYDLPSDSSPGATNGAIDILVATPGRLIDHLDKTKGFSLQHLRFLVIDEADRLVSQSYHSFIGRITESVTSTSQQAWDEITEASLEVKPDSASRVPITWRRPNNIAASLSLQARVCQQVQLRKLLFSATLTKDPQKLASLGLVNPKFYNAHHLRQGAMTGGSQRYAMPQGLSEHIVECTAEQKPLVLLSLLLEHSVKNNIVVVFTSSLDSTHRLARLLQLLWQANGIGDASRVVEFSSVLNQSQRSQLVQRCNETDEIQVVVCSDGLSRGMDIARVNTVVNYDIPSFAKTYVHRCGRTARAGRSGTAISLLKGGQVHQFHKIRQLIEEPERVAPHPVKKELVRDAFASYEGCVAKLRQVIADENSGELNQLDTLTAADLN